MPSARSLVGPQSEHQGFLNHCISEPEGTLELVQSRSPCKTGILSTAPLQGGPASARTAGQGSQRAGTTPACSPLCPHAWHAIDPPKILEILDECVKEQTRSSPPSPMWSGYWRPEGPPCEGARHSTPRPVTVPPTAPLQTPKWPIYPQHPKILLPLPLVAQILPPSSRKVCREGTSPRASWGRSN